MEAIRSSETSFHTRNTRHHILENGVLHFSGMFCIQNILEQGDFLSPLLLNFALDFAIRKVQGNQMGLKLNGTQLLVSADDINLLGDTIDTIKKKTQTLIFVSQEVGLEVNAAKTKYVHMLMSHY
jgi:hypothetical protein